MTDSPLFSPSRTRRSRDYRRRRARRRRIRIGAGVIAILAAACAIVLWALGGTSHHDARAGTTSGTPHRVAVAPVLSQVGLPLGRPALHLAATGPTVHVTMGAPPRAGLLFDLDSGRVLWERNPQTRLRIASLTKMMTALLVAERTAPQDLVLITRAAEKMPGSRVGVLPLHRQVEVRTLLAGLLLPSGNDAAVALAQHIDGTVARFVTDMNAHAAALGMSCTRYSSPSGYYDAHNYSCADDLALLAHADLAQPRIAAVTRLRSAVEPLPIKGGRVFLYNNNPLVRLGYPGITGLKTGFTDAAGDCLVATATRDGIRLGVVLLHSTDEARQARVLLDKGFALLQGEAAAAPAANTGATG